MTRKDTLKKRGAAALAMAPEGEALVEAFSPQKLKDSLVVVAFPTTGQAASIAAHYLIRHLALPLVGHVRAPDLQNVVAIQDGRVTSAIRVFGGEVVCRLGKDCPRIYLVTTELAVSPPLSGRLAEAVLGWVPREDLEAGIAEFVAWYGEVYGHESRSAA